MVSSSLYSKVNRMQGGYGNYNGDGIGYTANGRGDGVRNRYEQRRQGGDYEQFKQALMNVDDSFLERMQEEARQRGMREDEIRQGMNMIQQMRQGGNGGGRRSFRVEKGGKYYG